MYFSLLFVSKKTIRNLYFLSTKFFLKDKIMTFKLTENFLDQYKGKQPKWGPLGYFVYKRCVDIDTPVLCDNLEWKKAGELKEGQGIIGFDEEQIGNNRFKYRYIRHGYVTHNSIEEAETIGIELEDGTILYATPEHSWLVKFEDNSRTYWRETKDLEKTKKNGNIYLLRPFGKPWKKENTYEAGFLAAGFDGEGNLDRISGINFTQVQNKMLEKIEALLQKRGILYKKSLKNKNNKNQPCFSIRFHGIKNIVRFLGQTRPPRLLKKFKDNLILKSALFRGQQLRCALEDYVKVKRTFLAGKRKIAVLSTSIKTHFTGGFASHNTYARRLEEEGRLEEFWETLKRVVEGTFTIQKKHCTSLGLPWKQYEAQISAQKMFEKMWNFKFLPPGRGLWIMGTEFIDKHGSLALNNCSFVSTHDIDIKGAKAFEFAMDALMLGVGVGFDTEGADKLTIKYPKKYDKGERFKVIIPDTREGWVESLKVLLISFFEGKAYPEFDFSLIRPAGQPIKGFGGISSGPGPLKDMLNEISELLMEKVGEKLNSTDIVDIMNMIGKCVVSGNVRRSAQISFGHIDDEKYLTMKDPIKNGDKLQNHRWASNNSVFCTPGTDYSKIIESIKKNGEPGLIWLDNIKNYSRMNGFPDFKDQLCRGANPCMEQSLESFEACNLVETFPSNHENYEEYEETLKYAYMYAKTVTLINTHWPETNAVMLKNRRIGVSQSGIIDAFAKHGMRKIINWCEKGYEYLQKKDKQYSDWLCVPRSIKITSVKPSGTISQLPGVSPGIHYPHSKYYIRRVRVMQNSSLLPPMIEAGYEVEDDFYSPNTKVISFPVKEENYLKSKNDITLWEQMENAALYQRHWADNQVSITVTFRKDEEKDLTNCLTYFEDRLKGISFLPISDHGYKQAPYEEITEEKYNSMFKKIKPVDLSTCYDAPAGEKYCSNDSCEIKK